MTAAKRKVSVSLDEDLVAALEAEGEGLSAQVNVAVRKDLDHRRRRRLLGELLDQLEREHGSPDEALIAKYMQLLA
jgi:antitoxin CcdA